MSVIAQGICRPQAIADHHSEIDRLPGRYSGNGRSALARHLTPISLRRAGAGRAAAAHGNSRANPERNLRPMTRGAHADRHLVRAGGGMSIWSTGDPRGQKEMDFNVTF